MPAFGIFPKASKLKTHAVSAATQALACANDLAPRRAAEHKGASAKPKAKFANPTIVLAALTARTHKSNRFQTPPDLQMQAVSKDFSCAPELLPLREQTHQKATTQPSSGRKATEALRATAVTVRASKTNCAPAQLRRRIFNVQRPPQHPPQPQLQPTNKRPPERPLLPQRPLVVTQQRQRLEET